jgi:hypothetical protein
MGCGADAIAVIEWNEQVTAEWIADAKPVQLLRDQIVKPDMVAVGGEAKRRFLTEWRASWSTSRIWLPATRLV